LIKEPVMRTIPTLALIALIATGTVWAATRIVYDNNYARDRAEIEDLQSRYLFALDWQDPQLYASTFTADGVLIWAGGTVMGRPAIVREMTEAKAVDARAAAGVAPLRPARRRHFISNIVLRIDGDRAIGRAYWFEFNDDIRDRRPYLGAYGHYEDELRRVDGQWLFTQRHIFNEQRDDMVASSVNPAW
jgi:SnoaL-like domain